MTDIIVNAAGSREFEVRVREDGRESEHHVTVSEGFLEELQVPGDDLERVVRESFIFLLEREPATAIMSEFSLDVIPRYFPEYREELPERL